MSNSKIRKYIYTALLILLIGCGIWYFLMHPAKYSEKFLQDSYEEHWDAFKTVTTYLTAKEFHADITGVPTVDNHFGIPQEDSDPYRAYVSDVTELMRAACAEIIVDGQNIKFYYPEKGGLLNRKYALLVYSKDGSGIEQTSRFENKDKNWYYAIVEGRRSKAS